MVQIASEEEILSQVRKDAETLIKQLKGLAVHYQGYSENTVGRQQCLRFVNGTVLALELAQKFASVTPGRHLITDKVGFNKEISLKVMKLLQALPSVS